MALSKVKISGLDSITATADELNYVDGVTSAIQTQMDAKSPIASPSFTGNVGIGNASPDGNLTIGDTSTSGDVSIRIKGDATSRGFLMFGDPGGIQLGDIMYDHSDNHMRFRVNNTERIRIDSSGNVGIGTSSPTQKLQVSGGSFLQQQSGATNSTAPTAVTVSNLTTGAHAAGLGASLLFTHVNSGGGYNGPKISSVSNADPFTSNLVFYSHNYSHSEAMRIDSSGNVGIGVSSVAGVKMDVLATASDNLVARFENNHATGSYGISVKAGDDSGNYAADFANKSGTSLMRIRGDGNVGIGTSSPATNLHVIGASRLQRPGGNSFEWAISSGGNYFLTDITNAAERMRITSSGNVGIGTSSPNEKLVSSGTVRALGATTSNESSTTISYNSGVGGIEVRGPDLSTRGSLNLYQAASNGSLGQTALHINSSGNVGIGTSSPQYTTQITSTSANAVTNILALHNGSNAAGTGTGARLLFKLANFENAIESRKYASIEGISTSNYNESIDLVFKTQPYASGGDVQERIRILSSGGITFNGDTAAANALDDYEEGNWTPTDGSGAGLSFSVSHATYVKIGRAVLITFDFTYPSTSNTNGASVSGLPFTVSSDGAGSMTVGYDTTIAPDSANKWWIGGGSTSLYSYGRLNNSLSGGRMIGSGLYFTS